MPPKDISWPEIKIKSVAGLCAIKLIFSRKCCVFVKNNCAALQAVL
jgi:hypothetical protein